MILGVPCAGGEPKMGSPKVFTPRPDQLYCFQRVLDTPYIGLFLGMSSGKTVITLSALDTLMKRGEVKRPLIVAPKKVSQATWQKEAKKWYHLSHLRFQLIEGTPRQREQQLCSDADIFVVGRDVFHWVVDARQKDTWPFDALVLDESSGFKSHSSRRFKKAKLVRPYCNRVILLTGTPAPKNYGDLFSQIYMLDMGLRLGRTITDFRYRFQRPTHAVKHGSAIMNYEMLPGAKEEIDRLISDIVVCLKTEDYVDLPEVTYIEHPVVLDKVARKAYTEMEKEMVLEFAQTAEEKAAAEQEYNSALMSIQIGCGFDIEVPEDMQQRLRDAQDALTEKKRVFATEQASVNMKLRQLCNGWVYDREGEAHHVHDCKKEWLQETLESLLYEGRQCFVLYAFKFDVDVIKSCVPKGHTFRELKTPQDEADWNAGKIDVLIAHPASCAHGLNLQGGGGEEIWYGLTNDLELFEQANMRLRRDGRTLPVTIHIPLVEESMDETIYSLLKKKANVQDGLRTSLQEKVKALAAGRL